jgi:hypothetical protein
MCERTKEDRDKSGEVSFWRRFECWIYTTWILLQRGASDSDPAHYNSGGTQNSGTAPDYVIEVPNIAQELTDIEILVFSTTARLNGNGRNRMWLAVFTPKTTCITDHRSKDLSMR